MENQAYLLRSVFYHGSIWWFGRSLRGCTSEGAGITIRPNLRDEAFALGAFWLTLAVLVDYVGFVLIKNPISLSPHDFYIGQFPWIYLIYVAVFFSPWCYVTFVAARGSKAVS